MKTSKSRRRKIFRSQKSFSRAEKKPRKQTKPKLSDQKRIQNAHEAHERIDWLSPTGKIMGTVDKKFAHTHGLFHAASHIYILDSKKHIIIQKRGKWMLLQPGKWDTSAGGHVGAGEKPEAAGKREAREEMGAVGKLIHLGKMDIVDKTPAYYNRERIFYFFMKSRTPIRYQKSEVETVARIPLEKMDSFLRTHACTPWLKESWKKFGAKIKRMG